MKYSYVDFEGEGVVATMVHSGYFNAEVEDVEYDNNPGEKVTVVLKNGDDFSYVREMIEKRKQLPLLSEQTPRDIKAIDNCFVAINKLKPEKGNINEDIIKKIKSSIVKYSGYKGFDYRTAADLIESKAVNLDIDYSLMDSVDFEMNDDYLSSLIILETIKSLREYSLVHPKIKLLIAKLGEDVPMKLQFKLEE